METMEAESQDLSFVQLFSYYAGRGIRLREETFEKNLGLLTPAGRFNLLAQLLSAYGRSSYEFRENSISLTIPFEWLGDDSNWKKGGRSRAEASPDGTDTEAAILAELMDNPNLTQPQLSSRLGRGLRTVQRALASLQEQGRIERPVQRRGHRLLASIVVYRHLIV